MDDQIKKIDAQQLIVNLAFKYGLEGCIDYLKEFFKNKKEDSKVFLKAFNDLFPKPDIEFIKQLGEASNYYFLSILIADKILDEKVEELNKEALLLSYVLREQSLQIMYKLFPPDHIYWDYFLKYYKEYIKAVNREAQFHFNKISDYSIFELEDIYAGNSSFAKAIPTALALKYGKEKLIPSLEKSIDYYYIALNLNDDIGDWKRDFINHQYSYLLTHVVLDNKIEAKINTINTEELGNYVFFSGIAEKVLTMSHAYYEKAMNSVKDIKCLNWKDIIANKITECIHYKEDISLLVKKELIIAGVLENEEINNKIPLFVLHLPTPENPWQKISNSALNYIYSQWKNGFLEASSYRYFPNGAGFSFTQRYYVGDVFQRSVIADILIDANNSFGGLIQPIVDYEVNYLLEARRSDNEGWSFYPTCFEQPCDADTTAQVIQVLLKSGLKNQVDRYAQEPIETLFTYQQRPDGSFGTWIVPSKNNCNDLQRKQRKFYDDYIQLDIDKSKDVDVIANMSYALFLYDKNKYNDRIGNSIRYLENMQNEKGYWDSTWYFGPFYGTYVCLRLLTNYIPNSNAILKSKDFLLNSQRADGGWGLENKESDPLNTAYVLICLSYLEKLNLGNFQEIKQKALIFLNNSINNDGHWPSSDYINFQKQKFTTFRSKTITNAYVLKAALLCNNS